MKRIEDSETSKQLAKDLEDKVVPRGTKYDGTQCPINCQVMAWVLLLKLPRGLQRSLQRMSKNRVNFCPETGDK